jgi:hypothetical protein
MMPGPIKILEGPPQASAFPSMLKWVGILLGKLGKINAPYINGAIISRVTSQGPYFRVFMAFNLNLKVQNFALGTFYMNWANLLK